METEFRELDFGTLPLKLKLHEEYMDMYECIPSEVVSTTRFDENSNLGTTYLGRIKRTKTS